MATALSNLLALLALDNKAYMDGLSQSQKAADDFGGKLATVGGAVVMGALTAAAAATVAIGTAAFDAAETVDEAYDIISVATGATGDALKGLQDDFNVVFTSIPTDAATAADAIGLLNSRLGLTGDDLTDLAIPLLEVTRLLKGDLTQNADLFTRVMGDWNIPVEEASGSLDKLFVASQVTGADLATLMGQVVQYGAPMRNFGFSFESAAALLASFAAQGVNTEIVMSGMRIAQGKFITQGKDMAAGLWETIDAIQNAATSTDALAIATEVFGAKAAGDFADTIRAGKFDIDELVASMMNADGAILDAADATNDWGETWKVFQNKMTLALAPIGEKLREGFGSALDELTVIFERPETQAAMTKFADMAITALSALVTYIPIVIEGGMNLITFLQNNEGILIGIFAALGIAALAWGVTTAAAAWTAVAPFLPVIGVLLLVAAAVYLLYQAWVTNFAGIQNKAAVVAEFIKTAWKGVVDFFTALWNNPIIQAVVQTVLSNVQALFAAFKAAFSGDWYAFGQNIRTIWDNNWKLLVTLVSAAWENIKTAVVLGIIAVKNFFTQTNWGEVGRNIIQGIANGIMGGISIITNAAKNAAKAALDAAKGFLGIRSPSTLFEMQVGYMMAAGVADGWERGLQSMLAPAMAGLSPASVNISPAAMPVSAAGAGDGSQNETMILEEIRRVLRDLPDDIARAVAQATAKSRGRN